MGAPGWNWKGEGVVETLIRDRRVWLVVLGLVWVELVGSDGVGEMVGLAIVCLVVPAGRGKGRL